MSITFFLVRHALKEKNIGDVPITADGMIQAKSTALFFRELSITGIISSPLRRARETAEYISSEINSEIRVDNRLRERANWGDLPGQTFEDFVEMWDRCTLEPDFIPPVGDSSRQAGERLASVIVDISNSSSTGSSFIIVTHGGLITDFLVHAIPTQELNKIHQDFVKMQSQLVPECSITKLGYESGTYKVEFFSSIDHL